jgi:flagellar basal-body rod protein FlgC
MQWKSPRNRPSVLKYDPDHPDANEEGYVAYPDINVMK